MGNICMSAASVSENDAAAIAQYNMNGKDYDLKNPNHAFDTSSLPSSNFVAIHDDIRDQNSLSGAGATERAIDSLEQTKYHTVTARFLNFQGSWLGNVVGTVKLRKYAFSRNTQLFLTIHKKTKVSMLVQQEEFGRNRRAACIMIFKAKNNGKKLRAFRDQDVFYKSRISMRPIKVNLELEPTADPYVVIVTHTTTKEGGYTLAIEGDQDMSLKVPRTYTQFFDEPKRHRIVISGEWKDESACGCPETNPAEWLKHCIQIPVVVVKPTRCLIRLTRTSPQCLSMGLFAVKSNGQASSEQYYAHQSLLDDDVMGKSDYTSTDIIEYRAFLQPKLHPYIFIPVVEHKGFEGTFELEVMSDEEIYEVKQNRIKKSFEDQGIWFERSCGGRPGTEPFFRCPQYFLTIKVHDDDTKLVPVTITVEQHVEVNQYIPAGFYVVKAGYRVTKKNFQESMIVARKPSGFMKKITTEVRLVNGQSYTIIPCPRSYNFARDIPFTITLSTFLPSDTSIAFDPCPSNSDEFDNLEEFKVTRMEGTWQRLTSGGDPLSGKGFFNNPQYALNTDVRTRLEISLRRTSAKWIPMAFFIIRTSEANKKLTSLESLQKDHNGLIGHSHDNMNVDIDDRIIGQVRFTSGIEEEVSGNFTLASGTYTVVVASQISGREGDYVLQLKADQDIELIELPQIECHVSETAGSFVGGLTSLDPSGEHFENNPQYSYTCDTEQHVFLSLSQPEEQHLNLALHLKCNDELVHSSSVFSWKDVTLQISMLAGKTYKIYVATENGREGVYDLAVCSDTAPITLVASPSTVIEGHLTESSFAQRGPEVSGEWYGLCDPSFDNAYNPRFTVENNAESNILHISIQSRLSSLGFRILRQGDESDNPVVYDSGVIENNDSNVFTRRVHLTSKGTFTLEMYPGEIAARGSFSLLVKSTQMLSVEKHSPIHTQSVATFEASWNIGRISGADYRHHNFTYNPQWKFTVGKKMNVVFEIDSLMLKSSSNNLPNYNSRHLFDEVEDYLQITHEHQTSMALYIVHSKNLTPAGTLESVKSDDIVCWSGWRPSSSAVVHAQLEPSETPYFVIASGVSLHEQRLNSFKLNVFSDSEVTTPADDAAEQSKGESMNIEPVEGTVFKNFEPDDTFTRQSIHAMWNLHACGHPDVQHHKQEWIKNNKVKIFVPKDTRAKITVSCPPIEKAVGMVIIKPHPINNGRLVPNLYENLVFANSIYDPQYEGGNTSYVYLSASEDPYYIVPFTYHYQQEPSYELIVQSDTPDVRLELDYDPATIAEPISFVSGWRTGVAGGDPEENVASFLRNPRFNLEISDNAKEKILFSLESDTKNKIKILIFKQSATPNPEGDSIELALGEEMCSSRWSLNGKTSCEMPGIPGKYVVVPSIYPAHQDGHFTLRFQRDDGVTISADARNLKCPQGDSISDARTLLLKASQRPSPPNVIFSTSFKELNCIPFEVVVEGDSPADMRAVISHSGKFFTTIGFYIFAGNTLPEAFEKKNVVVKSAYTPYANSVDALFALEKGNYLFVPILATQLLNGAEGLEAEEFFVKFEFNKDAVTFDIENSEYVSKTDSIPENRILSLSDFKPHPEVSSFLDNVQQIAMREDDNGRFPSPLIIYGPSVFPILTGTSTSMFMYETHSKQRRQVLERLDKMAISNRTLLDLYLPYAGAGAYGNGRVVAIGDIMIFSRHQLTTFDNQAFLMNCISWLLPDTSNNMHVDMFSVSSRVAQKYRAGGLTRSGSSDSLNSAGAPSSLGVHPSSTTSSHSSGPTSSPKVFPNTSHPSTASVNDITVSAATRSNSRTSQRSRISKPVILCYSKVRDYIPVDSLSYDHEIRILSDLDTLTEIRGDIIFLVFTENDVVSLEQLKKIKRHVKSTGAGLMILGNCHGDDHVKHAANNPANILLSEVGMVFGDSDLVENTHHNHEALWWLTQEEKKQHAKPPSFELQSPSISVSQSMHHAVHVGECLRLYLDMLKTGEHRSSSRFAQLQQMVHVLYYACYTIPASDRILLPCLLELFGNPNLLISTKEPVKKTDIEGRLAVALNTNLWMTMNYRDMPSLRDREYAPDAETHEITLSKDYQHDFSTGVYARSGEVISLTVPNSLVDVGCHVQIGFSTQNLIWLRDSDLERYPLQWNRCSITQNKTHIANPFGGQMYITIPASVFKSIKKHPLRIHVTGGIISPQFKLQQTTPQHWQQQLASSGSIAPYCEWICDKIILTLPTKDAKLISDPTSTLKFWRDGVHYIEKAAHSRYNHTQRILVDQQIAGANTRSGFPVIVNENLLWKGVIATKENQLFDNCGLLRELAHNMHQKHSYVWNQRGVAIANVYKAYALEKILGIKINQTEFYSQNIGHIREFLLQGDDLSRAKRAQMYQNDAVLSTMFEFILIEAFGWSPYEKLFKFFHEEFDVKNRRILTNQEKVDRWVVRFCEHIQHDISNYVERFGLRINTSTKAKVGAAPATVVVT
uniref:Peptidase M60 domain-containing protein n=1 Tax=Percolomonas cosmopolitus TaxID=63605 RepID=A0A7S1KTQ0_9EUKA|mmetsp:Transcript_9213/g.34035  ORF Transcript_9213/g.34035 Transcript_9213/m.34035 type:complete len:2463 (+) Transcript_9213:487-7875(+)|eukprot:CAMPEP_0117441640 /NCGR_PEP_ID=MMETSP0759-20121206/3738_1 /TAXON_ID=63605 /ORGANISM="Percolomonas cosmopolitus, Strain WS" /LENGTH=2462 /DNA_ID=CAMNT_0005233499 /DNA_START=1724 /DNA_END=9112 /DNA_ORIENTATION=+